MTPNVVALVGFAALILALQLQVRLVEEPYLVATPGAVHVAYPERVGRFVPGIGATAQ